MTTTESQITSGKAESIDVEKLRELAQAAKPGPWKYNPVTTEVECDFDDENSCSAIVYVNSGDFTHRLTIAHGQFIAAANPAVILALIDHIAHIEAVREKDRDTAARDKDGNHVDDLRDMLDELQAEHDAQNAAFHACSLKLKEVGAALDHLAEIASQCDSWQSFPDEPLNRAYDALALLSPAQQEPAKGCSKCGSTEIHACPGAPIPPWTPEKIAELHAVLAEYEQGRPTQQATNKYNGINDLGEKTGGQQATSGPGQLPSQATLESPSIPVPAGLGREQTRAFILSHAAQATPEGGNSKIIADGLEAAHTLINLIPTRLQNDDHEDIARIGEFVNEKGGYNAINSARNAWLAASQQAAEITPGGQMHLMIKFLLGEWPLDGAWFGETPEGQGKFWWRNRLCEVFSEYRAAPLQQVEKDN